MNGPVLLMNKNIHPMPIKVATNSNSSNNGGSNAGGSFTPATTSPSSSANSNDSNKSINKSQSSGSFSSNQSDGALEESRLKFISPEFEKMLHCYIYDFLKKKTYHQTASCFVQESSLNNEIPSPPIDTPGGFLIEWWSVFWEVFLARSGHSPASESSYTDIASLKPELEKKYKSMQQTGAPVSTSHLSLPQQDQRILKRQSAVSPSLTGSGSTKLQSTSNNGGSIGTLSQKQNVIQPPSVPSENISVNGSCENLLSQPISSYQPKEFDSLNMEEKSIFLKQADMIRQQMAAPNLQFIRPPGAFDNLQLQQSPNQLGSSATLASPMRDINDGESPKRFKHDASSMDPSMLAAGGIGGANQPSTNFVGTNPSRPKYQPPVTQPVMSSQVMQPSQRIMPPHTQQQYIQVPPQNMMMPPGMMVPPSYPMNITTMSPMGMMGRPIMNMMQGHPSTSMMMRPPVDARLQQQQQQQISVMQQVQMQQQQQQFLQRQQQQQQMANLPSNEFNMNRNLQQQTANFNNFPNQLQGTYVMNNLGSNANTLTAQSQIPTSGISSGPMVNNTGMQSQNMKDASPNLINNISSTSLQTSATSKMTRIDSSTLSEMNYFAGITSSPNTNTGDYFTSIDSETMDKIEETLLGDLDDLFYEDENSSFPSLADTKSSK